MQIAREPATGARGNKTPVIPSVEARVRPVIRRAVTPVRLALLPFPCRRNWSQTISDAPGSTHHEYARCPLYLSLYPQFLLLISMSNAARSTRALVARQSTNQRSHFRSRRKKRSETVSRPHFSLCCYSISAFMGIVEIFVLLRGKLISLAVLRVGIKGNFW